MTNTYQCDAGMILSKWPASCHAFVVELSLTLSFLNNTSVSGSKSETIIQCSAC